MKPKTSTIHINVPVDDLRRFDLAFPSAKRRFICNAIKMALNDKVFFDKVFFSDLYYQSDNTVNL